MEKYEFIQMMLQHRRLSVNDKKRLLLLATKEIEQIGVPRVTSDKSDIDKELDGEGKKTSVIAIHAPKDTASFLSLFNNPNGFKFLTHDFDPDSDMDYDKLMSQVRDIFKSESSRLKIPPTLWSLVNVFINGGNKEGKELTWRDCDGIYHKGNYSCKDWKQWAIKNPHAHLISNEEISMEILKFRSSIRLVKPVLCDIVNRQATKHPNLSIQTAGLEKADFYTYVWALENGINRILDDMSRYAHKTPKVKITFRRSFGDDYSRRIIQISQIDSNSSSLDDVLYKFKGGGGAFNEIKKVFFGYCNWSVESLWDGKAKRWNILNDADTDEIEDMDALNVPGFTHTLTFFSK